MQAAIAPQIAALNQQKEEAARLALQRAQATSGFGDALAQLLAQLRTGDNIQQGFQQASDRQAAYGSGYSKGLAGLGQASADAGTAELGKLGLPGSISSPANQGGAEALYQLGGAIPANSLATSGAAFKAAADFLPATSAIRGKQDANAALYSDGPDQQKINDALQNLNLQRPGLLNQALATISDQQHKDAQLGLSRKQFDLSNKREAYNEWVQQKRLGQADQNQSFNQWYKQQQLRISQQNADTAAQRAIASGQKVVGSDAVGRWAFDPVTGQITQILPPVGDKNGKPKWTAKQISEFKAVAADSAADAWNGIRDPKTGKLVQSPQHYQQALMAMVDHGIPLEVAQAAMNRYWKRPGYDADIKGRINGKVYWFAAGTGRPRTTYQDRNPKDSAAADGGVSVRGATAKDAAVVNLIQQYIGTPYQWGGTSPNGFDCSGLLQYVWKAQGVNIPRTTYDQWKSGVDVTGSELRPGDAVFFEASSRGPGHVGMYIGNGRFVEAPHTGAVVRISRLAGRRDYVGARRFG